MRVAAQPAWVIHARAWRETSLLLEVFTRDHGRVGLVARGVRRERSRTPRGLLQPLQPLLLDWVARGELGTLAAAEAASSPIALDGEGLLAAFYVNELVLRLAARHEALPHAFACYGECLEALVPREGRAWALRRFERDFLADAGYALMLDRRADGAALDAAAAYAYDPDAGPRLWREGSPFARVSGAALLALAVDECPPPGALAELRRLARAVIRHRLGRGLAAWTLASVRPRNG